MGKERMNREKTVKESVLNTVPKISDYFVQTFGSGYNPKKLSYLHNNLSAQSTLVCQLQSLALSVIAMKSSADPPDYGLSPNEPTGTSAMEIDSVSLASTCTFEAVS